MSTCYIYPAITTITKSKKYTLIVVRISLISVVINMIVIKHTRTAACCTEKSENHFTANGCFYSCQLSVGQQPFSEQNADMAKEIIHVHNTGGSKLAVNLGPGCIHLNKVNNTRREAK